MEQFAYPLNGPPTGRRGDVAMVLRARAHDGCVGRDREIPVTMVHERELPPEDDPGMAERAGEQVLLEDAAHHDVLWH